MGGEKFQIKATLRHRSFDPTLISEALSLKPDFSWQAGSRAGDVIHESTLWHGILASGGSNDEFGEALERSLEVLESRADWLKDFVRDEGEIEIIFGLWTELEDGIISKVAFYPECVVRFASLNVELRVEVWRDKDALAPL